MWQLVALLMQMKTALAGGVSVPVLGPSQWSTVAPFDLCCLFMQKLFSLFPGLAYLTNPHALENKEERKYRFR